jgi:RNA polymerase sigma factor (sigma-70 family)
MSTDSSEETQPPERVLKRPKLPPASRKRAHSSAQLGADLQAGRILFVAGHHEACRCGVDSGHLEDFLSEFFIGCWLSPDPNNVALTCTCGANRARSFLRKERRWAARTVHEGITSVFLLVEMAGALPSHPGVSLRPDQVTLCHELHQRLEGVLAQLTVRQRRVLYLRHYEGVPFSQIAEETGQSATAARVMAHSGHRRLLELLEAEGLSCAEADEYLTLLNRDGSEK